MWHINLFTLEESLSDVTHVFALTSRRRSLLTSTITLEEACDKKFKSQSCAFLFGCERNGLDNAAIALADHIVTIPAHGISPSLNLAQTAMLVSYAWSKNDTQGKILSHREEINMPQKNKENDMASMGDIINFFRRLETFLEEENFFRPQERKHTVIKKLRTIFKRTTLRQNELALMRGVIETLAARIPPPS